MDLDSSQFSDPPTPVPIAPPPLPGPLQPVIGTERIVALDVIRGVALFGILFVNIQDFAMVKPARYYPMAAGGEDPVNQIIWLLTHTFADSKFIAIFSMLFGAGIVLMSDRWRARGQRMVGAYYRRMLCLLVIGFAHFALLWDGDILYYYAVCGFALYFAPRLPLPAFFIIGLTLYGIFSVLYGFGMLFSDPGYLRADVAQHLGTWGELFQYRLREPFEDFVISPILYGFATWGLMILGMAFYRLGLLRGALSTGWYVSIAMLTFPVGLGLVAWGTKLNPGYESFVEVQQFFWGSFLLSLSYICMVVIATKIAGNTRIVRALGCVGRMALTNYLMHSLICSTIFYGYGLGQYGRMDRVGQTVIVLSICVCQLFISYFWLRFFRFGPVEWIWRTVTYAKVQPILRARAEVAQ